MRVLAFDPGGTTGWAQYDSDTDKFTCGHIGVQEHHLVLYNFLGDRQVRGTYVVCESFEYRRDQRENVVLVSREYIGVIKLFCQERNVPYKLQTASLGKDFWRDDKLRMVGLYHPGWTHANDAMRHLLYAITFDGRLAVYAPGVGVQMLAKLKPGS